MTAHTFTLFLLGFLAGSGWACLVRLMLAAERIERSLKRLEEARR